MSDKDKGIFRKDCRRLRKSFAYATKGIKEVFEREQNIKIQLVLTIVVIFYGLILHIGKIEFILLLLTISQVIALETINTGLEMYLDEKDKEQNGVIGIIKDVLAASVLISVIFAIIIGLMIFLTPTLKLLGLG